MVKKMRVYLLGGINKLSFTDMVCRGYVMFKLACIVDNSGSNIRKIEGKKLETSSRSAIVACIKMLFWIKG